jgi:hypothetical protein
MRPPQHHLPHARLAHQPYQGALADGAAALQRDLPQPAAAVQHAQAVAQAWRQALPAAIQPQRLQLRHPRHRQQALPVKAGSNMAQLQHPQLPQALQGRGQLARQHILAPPHSQLRQLLQHPDTEPALAVPMIRLWQLPQRLQLCSCRLILQLICSATWSGGKGSALGRGLLRRYAN